MARLTRAQSQAKTRAQLLATARELFLRDGYYATSLDKVAEAAGFSKGAVYSNFRNKDELCQAVLDEIRAERAAEIAELLHAPTTEERLQRLEKWAEHVIGDPQWTLLELEFGSQVRRDAHLREEQAERIGQLNSIMTTAITIVAQAEGIEPPMPPQELAVAVLALGVGLGLFRASDPTIPVSALTNTLRVLAGIPVEPPTASN